MPIFEYECTNCGERIEHLQLSSDAPMTKCPECGGAVRKLMSAPAFQFKGTGWYVTDYAEKTKRGAAGTSSEGGADQGADKASAKDSAKDSGDSADGGGSKTSKSSDSTAKSSAAANKSSAKSPATTE